MDTRRNNTLDTALQLINKDFKHVCEFGVYKGHTIKQMRESLPLDFEFFGFDSFEGLPEDWTGTGYKKGMMSVEGVIPNVENVTFYKGWFKDTIPQYLKVAKPIALLHVDCDLYSSTIDVLYGLKEFILPSTIIVFDEWYYEQKDIEECRQHEQKAFYEWVKDFNIKYELYGYVEMERKIVTIL